MTDVKIEMKGLVEKMGEAKQSVDGIVTDIKGGINKNHVLA